MLAQERGAGKSERAGGSRRLESLPVESYRSPAMRGGAVGLAWASVLLAGLHAESPRRDAVVEVVERVLPSVVAIKTEVLVESRDFFSEIFRDFYGPHFRQVRPDYSLGSGVFVDREGFVLTNAHVVRRANRILVVLHDGRQYEADVFDQNLGSDVALLRVRSQGGETFPAIQLATPRDLLLGETVVALGNPFGLGSSISKGILSSLARRPEVEGEMLDMADWLQTDAAINPGNSGGPLVNLEGEMIGLNVAVYREGQGIGFAIPVQRIIESLSGIFESGSGIWYGAVVEPDGTSLVVARVRSGSPADKGGLEEGDRILSIEGRDSDTLIDYLQILSGLRGSRASMKVQRGGSELDLEVEILPEEEFFNADLIWERTGMYLGVPDPSLRRFFRMRSPGGLILEDVRPGSPADRAGLVDGGILVSINGRRTDSLVQVAKQVDGTDEGEVLELRLLYRDRLGRVGSVFKKLLPGPGG